MSMGNLYKTKKKTIFENLMRWGKNQKGEFQCCCIVLVFVFQFIEIVFDEIIDYNIRVTILINFLF